ncbi:DUF167 domain-containing protein [Pleurocapsa sp. FMAR1]|uniref:DUF167 domain-containing protein n=1 Tax=Pleurocapsa sp. FMAR1 TaxID=3040204 RepID=UPI0029C8CC0D|nr:DUF167 domain-containing protein [Pleurocapsa sp. FMAR1]
MKIKVKVKPNSGKQEIEQLEDGSLVVHLKSSPVKGKANQELIKVLAKKYQVTQSQVAIKSGLFSKRKLIEIE